MHRVRGESSAEVLGQTVQAYERVERHGVDNPAGQSKQPVEDNVGDKNARQVRDDRDQKDRPVFAQRDTDEMISQATSDIPI